MFFIGIVCVSDPLTYVRPWSCLCTCVCECVRACMRTHVFHYALHVYAYKSFNVFCLFLSLHTTDLYVRIFVLSIFFSN